VQRRVKLYRRVQLSLKEGKTENKYQSVKEGKTEPISKHSASDSSALAVMKCVCVCIYIYIYIYIYIHIIVRVTTIGAQ
jgi:hypothetical protein